MMMKTKYKTFSILFIMFISALLFSCQFIAANGKGDKMFEDTSIPKPKLTNKIDLSYVGKASCSGQKLCR